MKKVVNVEEVFSKSKDYILFDIETTGLSRTKDYMYMFGICERNGKNLIFTQYYVEDEKDEISLILKINEILKNKKVISYNGDRFDFPFIRKRANFYNLKIENIENKDIYRELQKLNFLLKEKSLKAINLGQRLGLDVHDHITNEESVKIFKMYSELKDKKLLAKLIYHNYIDLKVLSKIYEYKENILEKILTINNKNFKAVIENIYLKKNYLIIKLNNLTKNIFEYTSSNFHILGNEKITISLELEFGFVDNKTKGYTFKLKDFSNKNFKFSKDLKENRILLVKNGSLVRENLLLLLNILQ